MGCEGEERCTDLAVYTYWLPRGYLEGYIVDFAFQESIAQVLRFLACSYGAIAKWLRRQIRNLFSFGGAGSNPAGVG